MARREGWEQRLAELIETARTRAFAYGSWDCCLFACAVIAALTGDDPGVQFRGRYQTAEECAAVLRKAGGVLAIAKRVARQYGYRSVSPLQSTRGSILLGRIDGQTMLGVCLGARGAFVQPRGLRYFLITDPAIVAAWEIA